VILLIRHTEVAVRWAKKCYGRTDVGLSHNGVLQAAELASQLVSRPIAMIVHSGLKRSAHLALRLAAMRGVDAIADRRWQERDFGTWESRSWHSIWKETGNAMDGMVTDPQGFRPGGGETTAELFHRTVAAWNALPAKGDIVVVTHGGPIAAIRTMLANAPLTGILDYRVDTGSITELRRD
jgi:broad specificity phosphatase PhoE